MKSLRCSERQKGRHGMNGCEGKEQILIEMMLAIRDKRRLERLETGDDEVFFEKYPKRTLEEKKEMIGALLRKRLEQ